MRIVDETKEPRKQVPRAMFFATSSNAIMMAAFGICLMFCIGDPEAVSSSMLPISEVFYSAYVFSRVPILGIWFFKAT